MPKILRNINVPGYVNEALNILEGANFEAWIVGGFVRDSLINSNKAEDVDIATNAPWEKTKHLFENNNWTVYELGTKFGTVGVIPPNSNKQIEITTYRTEESYSDGRHPSKVEFVNSIKQDLARRDFCCNAIAYNPKKGFIDNYDGIIDIQNKIIRCVGDPKIRFSEDYLRILRALRFSAQLNFNIDPNTEKYIFEMKNKINEVSVERTREELSKLLSSKGAKQTLDKYRDIIFEIIPQMKALNNFDQHTKYHSYDAYIHTLIVIDKMPTEIDKTRFSDDVDKRIISIGKWAALLHDIGKPDCFTIDKKGQGHFYGHPKISVEISKEILKHFKFSTKTKDSILLLIRWHDQPMAASEKSVRKMLRKFSEVNCEFSTYDMFRIYCDIRRADSYAHAQNYREYLSFTNEIEKTFEQVIEKDQAFSLKDLAIKGQDILNLEVSPGPQVSEILNECLDAVIEEKIPNKKDKLITFAKTLI